MTLSILVLTLVTVQRLCELLYARANALRLVAMGAVEAGAAHYPFLIGVHFFWIFGLWWFGRDQPVSPAWLAVYLLLQIGRAWVLWTLGRRWTTRIYVLPGARLVRAGPYRFIDHPNYAVLAGEIAVLPLVFGLWAYAAVFTALNAAALFVRIRSENAALAGLRLVGTGHIKPL